MNNYRYLCAKISLFLGLFLILLMPLAISSAPVFPYITLKATTIQLSITFCLLAVVFCKKSHLSITPIHIATLAFLGIATVSAIIGIDPVRSLLGTYERQQGVITLAYWLVFALCLAHLIRDERGWRFLFQCASTGCYLFSILALAHYFHIVTIDNLYQDNDRLSYTIGNASIMGAYLACNVPLSTGLLVSAIREKRYSIETTLHVAGLLVLATTLLATGTRSSIIAGALWGCVSMFTLSRKIKLPLIGLMICIALIAMTFNWQLIETRIADSTMQSIAIASRLDAWSIALRAITAAPIIGIGAENFLTAFGTQALPGEASFETFDHPHSHLLDIAVSSGIAGLACYAALICVCIITLRRHQRLVNEDQAKENTLIIAGVLLMYQLTAAVLFEAHVSQLLFYLALAYCLRISPNLEPSLNLNWTIRLLGTGLTCVALLHTTTVWLDARAIQPFTTSRWHQHITAATNINRPELAIKTIAPKIWSDWSYLNAEQKTSAVIMLKNLTDQDQNFNWRTISKVGYAWLRIAVDFPDEAIRLSATADRLLQLAPGRWETYEFLAYFYLAQREKEAAISVLKAYLEKDPKASRLRAMLKWLEASEGIKYEPLS